MEIIAGLCLAGLIIIVKPVAEIMQEDDDKHDKIMNRKWKK